MKNEKEIIRMFVGTDENRPALLSPFRQDGKICATDGRILILIDESLCEEKYEEKPNGIKVPIVSKVIPVADIDVPLLAHQLQVALDKAPEEKDRTCTECGGDGSVMWRYKASNDKEYSQHGECPVCGGTGELDDYSTVKYQFMIYGSYFCYKHLKVILNFMKLLGISELRVLHHANTADEGSPMLLSTKGIEVLLMPQFKDTHKDKIVVI